MVAMKKNKLLLLGLTTLLLTGIEVQGFSHHDNHHHDHHHRRSIKLRKLFVFGDSYADTGNTGRMNSEPWKEPYGITFPGKPSGRYSDGRVFTDYLASFLGFRSPLPYRWRYIGGKPLRFGMNFAYGGAGVFNTLSPVPNIITQVDFFERLIKKEGMFTKHDLKHSMAHLSLAGNDYTAFVARGGSIDHLPEFIETVVNQLIKDVKRIIDLGVKRISINGLEPVGCAPLIVKMTSSNGCNDMLNLAATYHNSLLNGLVQELNAKENGSRVIVLDLYGAFMSIIQHPVNEGRWKFENPLKACCDGVNTTYSCGSVDGSGTKMYTLCERPESAFYWDSVHPTQAAWAVILPSLKTSIYNLIS